MDTKINYSIIIPHKNIPQLLRRCLSSIPRREDVQIIVVDDDSDLGIVDFEQFPGLDDPFIKIIFTKEGKGAGYARNVGMANASGKWLLFADADDFYNYCINDILDEYIDSDADIVYFKHNSLDTNSYVTTYRSTHLNTYIDCWLYSQKKAGDFLRYYHVVPWAKFIKRCYVEKNHILFDEISKYNDITFGYLTGFYAIKICVDFRALYCTTVRQGSIQYSKSSIENKLDTLFVSAKRYLFFKKHGISIFPKIGYANFITKTFLFDKITYNRVRRILVKLGFSSLEIILLCLYALITYIPMRITDRFFPREKIYLKFKKMTCKI